MFIPGGGINTAGILRNLAANSRVQASAMEKLSSGLRINKAADDPAGLVISEQLRAQIAGLERAVANSEHADNLLAITDGALGTAQGVLANMRKLAVQAANTGVSSPDQLAALQSEMDASLQALDRIMKTNNTAANKMLDELYEDGKLGRVPLEDPEEAAPEAPEEPGAPGMPGASGETGKEGEGGGADPLREGGELSAAQTEFQKQIDALSKNDRALYDTAKRLGSLGLSSLGGITLPGGLGGLLHEETLTLNDLYSGGAASLANDPIAAMRVLEQASKDIGMQRAEIGATMKLRVHERAAMEAEIENTMRTESGIRDTDMAATMTELVHSQITAQAGTRVLSAAMEQSRAMLSLLEW